MKVLRINKDGSMNDIEVRLTKKNLLSQLNKKALSKGCNDIKELYKWIYDGNTIHCYGWYDGDAGFENKHDLIPNGSSSFLEENSSEKLLFGDIFMLCLKKKKISDYCISDYAELYNHLFDGFDDCSEEDITSEEEGEETKEDKDFIIKDGNHVETDESYEYIDDEELDEDCNEY